MYEVSDIWFHGNMEAHNFISENHRKEKLPKVFYQRHKFIYVKMEIKGFIGIINNYIDEIFILKRERSKGIGKELLDYVKEVKENLGLNIYNYRSINFYKRENIDDNTEEKEIFLTWKR